MTEAECERPEASAPLGGRLWFSILSQKALAGSSFTSPQAARERIDTVVAAHNQTAKPFSWSKTVAQKT